MLSASGRASVVANVCPQLIVTKTCWCCLESHWKVQEIDPKHSWSGFPPDEWSLQTQAKPAPSFKPSPVSTSASQSFPPLLATLTRRPNVVCSFKHVFGQLKWASCQLTFPFSRANITCGFSGRPLSFSCLDFLRIFPRRDLFPIGWRLLNDWWRRVCRSCHVMSPYYTCCLLPVHVDGGRLLFDDVAGLALASLITIDLIDGLIWAADDISQNCFSKPANTAKVIEELWEYIKLNLVEFSVIGWNCKLVSSQDKEVLHCWTCVITKKLKIKCFLKCLEWFGNGSGTIFFKIWNKHGQISCCQD